jgi:hypothetical protein
MGTRALRRLKGSASVIKIMIKGNGHIFIFALRGLTAFTT